VPSSPPKAADHSVVVQLILVSSSVGHKVRSHKKPATVACSAMLTRLVPNAACGALSLCSIDGIRSLLLVELCRKVLDCLMNPSCDSSAGSFLRRRVAGYSFDKRSSGRLNDISIVVHLGHGNVYC